MAPEPVDCYEVRKATATAVTMTSFPCKETR
jgi:hypothetical protein